MIFRSRAFTLIELLIVIAIVFILIAIAIGDCDKNGQQQDEQEEHYERVDYLDNSNWIYPAVLHGR
jgi:prepilin-type N-terminal cleavage/methylation domain-containing protein